MNTWNARKVNRAVERRQSELNSRSHECLELLLSIAVQTMELCLIGMRIGKKI